MTPSFHHVASPPASSAGGQSGEQGRIVTSGMLSGSKYNNIIASLIELYGLVKPDNTHSVLGDDEIKDELLFLENDKKKLEPIGEKYRDVVATWPDGRLSLAPFHYAGFLWEFSHKNDCRVRSDAQVYEFQRGRLCYSDHTYSSNDFRCYYHVEGCDSTVIMHFVAGEVSMMVVENGLCCWSARFLPDHEHKGDVVVAQPKNVYRNFTCTEQ
jgi:hypothetical protein